jgi:hypothetical protein
VAISSSLLPLPVASIAAARSAAARGQINRNARMLRALRFSLLNDIELDWRSER